MGDKMGQGGCHDATRWVERPLGQRHAGRPSWDRGRIASHRASRHGSPMFEQRISFAFVDVDTDNHRPYTGTNMVAIRLEGPVPTTLTLKNIPDEVYERLKTSAAQHRRSLNSEAITCLESALMPRRVSVEERLARIRRLRAELGGIELSDADIDAFKREGRL
jgi:plasmid stability protein